MIAGGLYAPTMSLNPTMGSSFTIEAFVTVVAGGSNAIIGTLAAAALLGVVRATFTTFLGQTVGVMSMLGVLCLIIRLLPDGLSSVLRYRIR